MGPIRPLVAQEGNTSCREPTDLSRPPSSGAAIWGRITTSPEAPSSPLWSSPPGFSSEDDSVTSQLLTSSGGGPGSLHTDASSVWGGSVAALELETRWKPANPPKSDERFPRESHQLGAISPPSCLTTTGGSWVLGWDKASVIPGACPHASAPPSSPSSPSSGAARLTCCVVFISVGSSAQTAWADRALISGRPSAAAEDGVSASTALKWAELSRFSGKIKVHWGRFVAAAAGVFAACAVWGFSGISLVDGVRVSTFWGPFMISRTSGLFFSSTALTSSRASTLLSCLFLSMWEKRSATFQNTSWGSIKSLIKLELDSSGWKGK